MDLHAWPSDSQVTSQTSRDQPSDAVDSQELNLMLVLALGYTAKPFFEIPYRMFRSLGSGEDSICIWTDEDGLTCMAF